MIWKQTLGAAIPSPVRGEWLRWLLTAFGFWLMVATGPLWLNSGMFPQIPWFAWGCGIPRQVDLGLLLIGGAALIASGGMPANSPVNRVSLLSFAAALLGLMLLDQHRCQPWAYQWLLMTVVLAWARHDLAIGLLRLLTISIYVHSAVSKCDWSFCQGLGHDFWNVLRFQLAGMRDGNEVADGWWPLLFPAGEFLVALGLIWPRSRRWALWLATAMHLGLLHILGPWGLQHSSGVLIWNLFFIVQNWVLFSGGGSESVIPDGGKSVENVGSSSGDRAGVILMVWVVIWPLGEPWGYCDLWPAWGLYAQHGERVVIRVTSAARLKLPATWQTTSRPYNTLVEEHDWWLLRPQEVSLQLTRAPVYPQNRYILGVILGVVRDAQLPTDQIAGTWYFPANRWTGQQTAIELKNLEEIEQAAARCLWNALPRK